jgi:hypothetical protein
LDINFHYHGASGYSYGTNVKGHDVMVSPEGRVTRIYSLNRKADAVAYAGRFGAAKSARKFDIPAGTIRKWVQRGELSPLVVTKSVTLAYRRNRRFDYDDSSSGATITRPGDCK